MRSLKQFGGVLVFLTFAAFTHVTDASMRTYAQDHPWAYEVFGVMDMMSFIGGGADPYSNPYMWAYARRLQEPRPWWHHVLFWETPWMEVATPDDYPYRPHFDHDFPPTFK